MAKKPSAKGTDGNGAPAASPAQPATGPQAQAQGAPAQGPSLNVIAQYVKDFSFENPSMPASLSKGSSNPAINVNINVNANALGQTDFEVELTLEARAVDGETVIFNIELTYAGIFRLQNIPQDSLQPVVLIECPRLLFPFARQIVADASRNGGYPAVLLDPIDFAALYQQNAQRQQPQPPAN